jgi:Holliday junction resolvasome RuvABC endonuclease subunit
MASSERIIGLDLATLTGICVGNADEVPVLSHHRLPSTGEDVGRFLDAADLWMRELIQLEKPALICFEAPILPPTTAIVTVRKLHGLAGIVEMCAFRAGVEPAEVPPSVVKKNLTGRGNAQKPEMVAACKHYGFDPKVEDEADSFGVWLTAVRTRFPQYASRWDPMSLLART